MQSKQGGTDLVIGAPHTKIKVVLNLVIARFNLGGATTAATLLHHLGSCVDSTCSLNTQPFQWIGPHCQRLCNPIVLQLNYNATWQTNRCLLDPPLLQQKCHCTNRFFLGRRVGCSVRILDLVQRRKTDLSVASPTLKNNGNKGPLEESKCKISVPSHFPAQELFQRWIQGVEFRIPAPTLAIFGARHKKEDQAKRAVPAVCVHHRCRPENCPLLKWTIFGDRAVNLHDAHTPWVAWSVEGSTLKPREMSINFDVLHWDSSAGLVWVMQERARVLEKVLAFSDNRKLPFSEQGRRYHTHTHTPPTPPLPPMSANLSHLCSSRLCEYRK